MNTPDELERVRWLDMAVERAVGGLSEAELREYERLRAAGAAQIDESIERAAAAVHLALRPPLEPLPRELAVRIADEADRHFAALRAPGLVERRRSERPPAALPRWFAWGGWAAAAASFVAFLGALMLERAERPELPAVAAVEATSPDQPPERGTEPRTGGSGAADVRPARDTPSRDLVAARTDSAAQDEPMSAAEARAAMLAGQPFILRRAWTAAGDPAGRGVSGDVIWDARTQTGYMRFVGLRRNEAGREQYQLWIFDGRRDARYPVDGGVFDVDGGAEVVVPIRARLPVGTPLAFAVTREAAGGVVVSDRERIVVIARSSG